MKRREFLGGLAASAALLPFSGVVSVVHAQEKGKLTFLTPSAFSLAFSPILYASAAGLFKKEGIDVQVEAGRGAAQVVQLTAAKQVQTGRTGGANYMMARVNNNAPVIAIATIAQRSPFAVISSKDAPIRNPQDLAGKTIGVQSAGGSMEATLDLLLMRSKIDPKSVRRERVADSAASFGMIQAKRVDGFLGNMSAAIRLTSQNYPVATMPMDDGVPGQVYVAEESVLAANKDQFVAFLRAAYRSVQELMAMDDEGLKKAVALMRGKFDIPGADNESIAVADMRANRDLWTTSDPKKLLRCNEAQWKEGEELLRGAGMLKQPTTKPLYTNEIWEAANG
ncbi:ABC transporter substrate-binding protein [Pigmentiphaga sp.]|uniref:ABC transporter substrate-binding protein n=1 Tax=Pigmentiphaga sp. TaxID=1977564 RepID=UPI0025F51562|nr:ABC transporter substrate-binding protein [Pigmentiphaga sp.]MBX6320004.1 ABC transporter substrate-binding protein [Pigmentiphaga sp.]